MSRICPTCASSFSDDTFFCGHDGTITVQAQDPNDPDNRLGKQFGEYIVVARVAVKILHDDVAKDEVAVERFKREYETADMFDHPHIVKVIDFGETVDHQHYMTMEFLKGQELGHLTRTQGAQSPARTLRVLAQAALALEHAHEFGVIHRDLKPDNIFLCTTDAGDDVRILDFGSVKLQVETGPKLTAFGTTLGSPYYMSPEQAKGLPDVDTRTDVFALGAILYEMLSGKIAFEAPTVAEILMKIVRMMPDPIHSVQAGLPPGIHAVIEKSIAKKKEERYDSPVELIDAAFAAFGVAGGCAEWADRPQAELDRALAEASAPAAPAEPEVIEPVAPAAGPPVAAPPGADPTPAATGGPVLAPTSLPPAPAGVPSSNRLILFVGVALVAFGCAMCLGGALYFYL